MAAKVTYLGFETSKDGVSAVKKKFNPILDAYSYSWKYVTNHKPLLGLLSELKPIPSMCAARIQRWAILLSTYNYRLVYRRGS